MRPIAAAAAALLVHAVALAEPISYQGLLYDTGSRANGVYDLQFDLYTDETPGGPDVIVATEIVTDVPVSNGVFTVEIPFNPLAFNGDPRYLQVACRPQGSGAYTTLLPRQALTDTPTAVHADVADTLALPATLSGFTTGSTQGLLEIEHTNLNSGSALRCESPWSALVALAGNTSGAPVAAIAPVAVLGSGQAMGVAGTSGSGVGVRGASATGTGGEFSIANTGNALSAYTLFGAGDSHAAVFETSNASNTLATVLASSLSTQNYAYALHGRITSTSPGAFATAVRGENKSTTGNGVGVWGSQAGSGWGVYGTAGTNGIGVYGVAPTPGYAGYFQGDLRVTGNVHVAGTLSKAAGSFLIDHPLDPENKTLSHSFVESPDMKNIYDGVATLDADGRAEVSLPDYFEALNKDFRYQLTCLGGYAPVFIEREISANSFVIAGGKPGMRVSWQVTGARHDAYAVEHPIVVEADKPDDERGRYLNPGAFGMPDELAVGNGQRPAD